MPHGAEVRLLGKEDRESGGHGVRQKNVKEEGPRCRGHQEESPCSETNGGQGCHEVRRRRRRRKGEGETRGRSESQEGQGEGQEEVVERRPPLGFWSRQMPANFRYDLPHSYPDWLLTVPYPIAIHKILLNVPIDVLRTAQYRSIVFLSPGVHITPEIENQLSSGLKFMMPTPVQPDLIREAYDDFERRLKYKIIFALEDSGETDYNPRYDIPKKIAAQPDDRKVPLYLRKGLEQGRIFVEKTISTIPSSVRDDFRALNPRPRDIKQFLLENDLVVTMTDKNLGLAVSKRKWIQERCLSLLSNENNYEKIGLDRSLEFMFETAEAILGVSRDISKSVYGSSQLSAFVRSLVPRFSGQDIEVHRQELQNMPEDSWVFPVFYGIPKVHKTPVKVRPIVPCHSAQQNPCAIYVAEELKPLIKATTTNISGSKDLVQKLANLHRDKTRKCYLVSGDVVAFYPSIPTVKGMEYAAILYQEYINATCSIPEEREFKIDIFVKALNLACGDLLAKYNAGNGWEYYLQLNGLAMGVACSPAVAILFGWWFEKDVINTERFVKDVLYYGRYLDDCLALIYADSPEEALAYLKDSIQFEDCTIEWQVSESYTHFLDVTLHFDESGDLQWRPFRKSGNHLERIPWHSAHPLDVKRGTLIGEISRMATLSSSRNLS